VEWSREVLEPIVFDVTCDQPAERAGRHEVAPCAEEPEEPGERLNRKDTAAAHPEPDLRELVDGAGRESAAGHKRSVDCADRRPHDHVGSDVAFDQRL
jgi:hypothetical protein